MNKAIVKASRTEKKYRVSMGCLKASYDTLRVVMMLAKLAVMSGEATFEVR
jgi:hypothetical protein